MGILFKSRDRKFDKKGLAAATLVVIIIVIVGMGVLLYFYAQIAWTGNIDRSVCHQSVVYRATLPEFANAQEIVPLKCKTDKICITKGFFGRGSCEEFEGEEGVTTVSIDTVEDIEQVIAQDILSCWQTMGEGKLSLFSNFAAYSLALGDISSSCIICSRIAFDEESLKKAKIKKEDINVFRYMITHKVPNKEISYFETIVGNSGKVNVENVNKREFDSEELTVMFMQIAAPGTLDKITRATLTTLFGGVFLPVQIYFTVDDAGLLTGSCGDVSIGDEAQNGCSVVRAVNYDVDDVLKFCGKIESIS